MLSSDMDSNPYRPPQAQVRDVPDTEMDGARLASLSSGQKLAIYAICIYLGMAFLRGFLVGIYRPGASTGTLILLGVITIAGALVALVLSFIGLWRMASGIGIGVVFRVLMLLFMFVPLFNIIILLVLNARTTRALRQAGYRVGFFGVTGQRT
jgi:hypothetical protein